MMRSVLFALMFSGSVFGLSTNAYAQTSPDTRQTDQSEEDWRKSKKKGGTSSEDILDIIKNTRSSGVGNGRGYSPIDALPEESRRYLMKERAKRMAQAGPNEPVDVTYKPSEAAKSDSDLQDDEKAAWEKMAQGMNGAPNQGEQGQSQGGGSQGQQQGGGQSSDPSSQSGQSRSVMRGGSAGSVSDIMARIKGIAPSSGGTGQSQQSEGQQGQGAEGQGQQSGQGQSQSSQSGQGQQGQSQQQAQNQGQSQNQSQTDEQQKSNAQSSAEAAAKAKAQAEAANKAHSISHAPDTTSPTRAPEAISPLDRIKKVNQERNNEGSRSSASDYLKKKE